MQFPIRLEATFPGLYGNGVVYVSTASDYALITIRSSDRDDYPGTHILPVDTFEALLGAMLTLDYNFFERKGCDDDYDQVYLTDRLTNDHGLYLARAGENYLLSATNTCVIEAPDGNDLVSHGQRSIALSEDTLRDIARLIRTARDLKRADTRISTTPADNDPNTGHGLVLAYLDAAYARHAKEAA